MLPNNTLVLLSLKVGWKILDPPLHDLISSRISDAIDVPYNYYLRVVISFITEVSSTNKLGLNRSSLVKLHFWICSLILWMI